MSGHSKWSTIKRKKGALDAARGKTFTKIAREIQVSTREGGPDPSGNPRLRAALLAARAANMPKDNQDRAIKKGSGELEGESIEEVVYEGRGPSGVAFIIEVATDNRNRTVAELRHSLAKGGGELGGDGSATWMFDRRGVFVIEGERIDEDALMELALEAGAADVQGDGDAWVVLCETQHFAALAAALEPLEPATGELRWLAKPESALTLAGDSAIAVAKLWARLDELDDVMRVFCSASLPDDVLETHGP